MTKEEAIEILKGFDLIGSNEDIEFQYALDMAIEALEEDTVSRQAVLDMIDNSLKIIDGTKVCKVCEKNLRWIPVSERLPEEEYDVLVCNKNGDIEIARGSYSTEIKNEFVWYIREIKNEFVWYISSWRFGKVTAWMPLPPSYREEVRYEND